VVSSTAAATLRQLVMFVVDKVVEEDRQFHGSLSFQEASLPDGSAKALGPSAKDAFSVFEDLCLLANSERPTFLKLESLHKTFALELIESVLTNYHELFRTVSIIFNCKPFHSHDTLSMKSFLCSCSTISAHYFTRRCLIGLFSLLDCDAHELFSFY
jgi:hypothetical protein